MMSLEGMRDLLKGSLARSLGALSDQDRLAAAWPVACGKTMAGRGTVVGYADGIVRVQVDDGAWLRQLTSMRGQLAGEMARIAGVTVSEIHMREQAGVTIEDVRRVAELANLELTAEEEPRMQRDLNAILGHIAQLNELNTAGVPAMAQVGEMLGGVVDSTGNSLRADVVRPSLDRAAVMAAAPESDGRFFKVPKVIER